MVNSGNRSTIQIIMIEEVYTNDMHANADNDGTGGEGVILGSW